MYISSIKLSINYDSHFFINLFYANINTIYLFKLLHDIDSCSNKLLLFITIIFLSLRYMLVINYSYFINHQGNLSNSDYTSSPSIYKYNWYEPCTLCLAWPYRCACVCVF